METQNTNQIIKKTGYCEPFDPAQELWDYFAICVFGTI